MRLIDADATIYALNVTRRGDSKDVIRNLFICFLLASPTVDAVPVIRCRDCRWGKETCGNIECNMEYHSYDWYCPNGKRKEE